MEEKGNTNNREWHREWKGRGENMMNEREEWKEKKKRRMKNEEEKNKRAMNQRTEVKTDAREGRRSKTWWMKVYKEEPDVWKEEEARTNTGGAERSEKLWVGSC